MTNHLFVPCLYNIFDQILGNLACCSVVNVVKLVDLSPLSAMAQMSGVLPATGMPDPMSESNKRERSFQGTQAAANLKRQLAGPSPSKSASSIYLPVSNVHVSISKLSDKDGRQTKESPAK